MLNDLRDQVAVFLNNLKRDNFTEKDVIKNIEDELLILKESTNNNEQYSHQIYDILFLLLELAAKHKFDLDLEWHKGQIKKQKYLK